MSQPTDQCSVLEFLEFRAFGPTQRIETHAAIVFLEGERAWKVKKAVSLGYLEFSTLESRRTALETELTLNRRNAPTVYRSLHRVSRSASGGFEIDGSGEAAEWLLQMQRLPKEAFLDRWLETHAPDANWWRDLASVVHRSHQDAKVSKRSSATGLLRIVFDNNFQLGKYERIFAPSDVNALISWQLNRLSADADLLGRRTAQDRIRRCHGDLHLANIANLSGQPVLLDCLEFDEDFATMDVLYDLALLLMDLCHRGRGMEANALMRFYLEFSPEDADAIRLLPLFISMRAAMRAHVNAFRASEDPGAYAVARAYFDTALRTGHELTVG